MTSKPQSPILPGDLLIGNSMVCLIISYDPDTYKCVWYELIQKKLIKEFVDPPHLDVSRYEKISLGET